MTLQQQLQKLNIIPENRFDDYGYTQDPSVAYNNGYDDCILSINYDLLEQFFTDRFIEMVENKIKEAQEILGKSHMNFTAMGAIAACSDLLSTLKNYKNNK